MTIKEKLADIILENVNGDGNFYSTEEALHLVDLLMEEIWTNECPLQEDCEQRLFEDKEYCRERLY